MYSYHICLDTVIQATLINSVISLNGHFKLLKMDPIKKCQKLKL